MEEGGYQRKHFVSNLLFVAGRGLSKKKGVKASRRRKGRGLNTRIWLDKTNMAGKVAA